MRTASTHIRQLATRAVAITVMACSALVIAGCQRRHSAPIATNPGDAGQIDGQTTVVDLAGVVNDKAGVPLADVMILAWPRGRHGREVTQARSGSDGKFLLPRLRTGMWTLLAEAAGLGTIEVDQSVPATGPVNLALDGESTSLVGLVASSQGRPQPGAKVLLGGPSLRWSRETTSDEHGGFSFDGLGPGKYALRASLGGQVSRSVSQIIEEGLGRARAPVRLVLAPGGLVTGHVLDDSGQLLPEAAVSVLTIPSDDLPAAGTADEQGGFTVGPLAPGRYQVLARLDAYMGLEKHEVLVRPSGSTDVKVHLARTAWVSGRVLDEDGRPMVAVPVALVGLVGGRDELTVIIGDLPTAAEAAELAPASAARQGTVRSMLTDGEGHFAIKGVVPGRCRLEVTHPEKLPLRHEPLQLVPGERRELGSLVLATGVPLAGRVLNQEGQPMEGAIVEARPAGRPLRAPVRVTSDPLGQFALRVPVGEYQLSAQAKDHGRQSLPVLRALASAPPAAIEFRLQREGPAAQQP